jgi:hypothetical protein
MKFFWAILFLSFNSFGSVCSLFGISDSPQKLNCYIHYKSELEPLKVFCKDGDYRINWRSVNYRVRQAYHEEVETGPIPLIFQTNGFSLRAVSFQMYGQANLSMAQGSFEGICFYK